MPAKTYLRILQGGSILSLAIIFFVFPSLLFPFITSKQFSFNILIEILLAFWLVLLFRYPQYRPKKSYISFGLAAYFLVILISCLVSVDPNLSFWGDAERMLGFFHLAHFLALYFILITAFRSWPAWRTFFQISAAIATVVSLLGLFGANTYSSIGNTTYVSGYLIFNLYFLVLLFFRTQSNWRWLYLLPAVIMLFEFWSCHTSGGIIGLAASILLFFLLLGLLHRSRLLRRSALIVFILAVIAVGVIFSQYRSAWFQNSFLKNLTAQKSTFQTRLISWRGALADFSSHPILGTGFGNYAIIFDKHFDPKFFDYATTETYFDRAHNNLIDILSTTGVLGLLTYLSIFAAALYYLFKGLKQNGWTVGADSAGRRNLETVILLSLLAAYFIQNLAVFDSFVTYVALMMTLGFIYYLVQPGEDESASQAEQETKPILRNAMEEFIVLAILLVLAGLVISRYNLRPWRMFAGTIGAYAEVSAGQVQSGLEHYRAALSIDTPLDRDSRTTLINMLTSNPEILDNYSLSEARDILDYVISLAEKNVAYNPADSLMQLQLAQVLDTAARYSYRDLTRFNYYSRQAIEAVDRSIESSPRRVPVYLSKAQIMLSRGEKAEALEVMDYAISLNPNYYEGYCRLAQTYLLFQEEDKLGDSLDKCLDLGGLDQINSTRFLKISISHYLSQKEYERALSLVERLLPSSQQDAELWFDLTKIYAALGDWPKAQLAGQITKRLDANQEKELRVILKSAPAAYSLDATSSLLEFSPASE